MDDVDPILIDEEFLNRLAALRLVTRIDVPGTLRGGHRSRHGGDGLEFLDYRTYHPGDDLRYVDWSVYGRLDKLFVKLAHAEQDQTVHILLDMSRSMQWGTPPKQHSAKKMAAAIAYVCLANLDKTVLSTFCDAGVTPGPSARSKQGFVRVVDFLQGARPEGGTDINGCLARYAETASSHGIVVLISDLLDPAGYRDGLGALVQRKHSLHLVQVLDRRERVWDRTGNLVLTDIESGAQKRLTVTAELLERYRRRFDAFLEEVREFCRRYRIDYTLWDTRVPFEEALAALLGPKRLLH